MRVIQSGPRVTKNIPSYRTMLFPYFFLGFWFCDQSILSFTLYVLLVVSSHYSQNLSILYSFSSLLILIYKKGILIFIISYNTIYLKGVFQFSMSRTNSDSETKYWQHAFKQATKIDLGHICKQCKKPFTYINQELAVRRGGRIELKYHIKCFSGYSDPRTQKNSSFNTSKWAGSQQIYAPKQIYKKMRTGSHF